MGTRKRIYSVDERVAAVRRSLATRHPDTYWDGRLKRRLKRLWPLGCAIAVLAGGVILAALLT